MKKIKSIRQLQEEKNRILQKQHNLENKIQENWADLKESARPVNIAKETISNLFGSKQSSDPENKSSFLKSTILPAAGVLASRWILGKAGKKIFGLFRK